MTGLVEPLYEAVSDRFHQARKGDWRRYFCDLQLINYLLRMSETPELISSVMSELWA